MNVSRVADVPLLQLNEPLHTAAVDFLTAFPDGVITSGRRTLQAQADAVAFNVAKNSKYVEDTYVDSVVARDVQAWVDGISGQSVSLADVAAGILSVLETFGDEDLAHFSSHLGGGALDVQPDGDSAKKTWLYARAQQINGRFLEEEAGLVRWHLQGPVAVPAVCA